LGAVGSCGEVENWVMVYFGKGYVGVWKGDELIRKVVRIWKMIYGVMKRVSRQGRK